MLPFSPYWSISAGYAAQISHGIPALVDRISAATFEKQPRRGPTARLSDTAVIQIEGILTKGESLWSMLGLGTSTRTARRELDAALANENISRIVLLIDSPGGTVDGTIALTQDIRAARNVKPIVAQVDGFAEGTAYWIAAAASQIYAGPGDTVGGVGLRLMLYDFSKQFERDGIEAVPIDTGPYKSAGALGTAITKDHRAHFQENIDMLFRYFWRDVLVGRGARILDHRAEITAGGSFIARRALDLGLIDEIRHTQDTLDARSNQAAKARAHWREIQERSRLCSLSRN